MYGDRAEILSAGSAPSRVNPLAIEALDEVGIDIRTHASKSTSDVDLASVDLVVTLCADEVCPVVPARVRKLHWPFADPARPDLSLEEQRRMFRDVREQIREKLAMSQRDLGLT